MPSSKLFLVEGFTPSTVTVENVTNMIRGIAPAADIGLVLIQATTPNVTLYPELARFLWLNSANGTLNRYNSISWVKVKAEPQIAGGSLDIDTLSVLGVSPLRVAAVNSTGTEAIWETITNLLKSSDLPVVSGTGPKVLHIIGTNVMYKVLDFSEFADKVIPYGKLSAPTGNTGKSFRVKADGGVELFDPTSALPSGPAGGDLSGSYPSPVLAPTGVVAGTYGGVAKSVGLTIDAKGRITAASQHAIGGQAAKLYAEVGTGSYIYPIATGTGTGVLVLDSKIDPSNIVTLASNYFTLEPGTYKFELHTHFNRVGTSIGSTTQIVVALLNTTSGLDVDYASTQHIVAPEVLFLETVFTIGVTSVFALNYFADPPSSAGHELVNNLPANRTPYFERGNQVIITKIA